MDDKTNTEWKRRGYGHYEREYPHGWWGVVDLQGGSEYYATFMHSTHERGKDQLYEPSRSAFTFLGDAQSWCDRAFEKVKLTPNLGQPTTSNDIAQPDEAGQAVGEG